MSVTYGSIGWGMFYICIEIARDIFSGVFKEKLKITESKAGVTILHRGKHEVNERCNLA